MIREISSEVFACWDEGTITIDVPECDEFDERLLSGAIANVGRDLTKNSGSPDASLSCLEGMQAGADFLAKKMRVPNMNVISLLEKACYGPESIIHSDLEGWAAEGCPMDQRL